MSAISPIDLRVQTQQLRPDYDAARGQLIDRLSADDLAPGEADVIRAEIGRLDSAWSATITATPSDVFELQAVMRNIRDVLDVVTSVAEGSDAGDTLFGEDPLRASSPGIRREVIDGRVNIHDGASLLELQERDPTAFGEFWRDMPAEDRQVALFNMQQEMQLRQQLTTLMTNTLQSSHQAAMAVARNLSV